MPACKPRGRKVLTRLQVQLHLHPALLLDFDQDAARCHVATLGAAARAARLQGNFGAAESFLKELPAYRKVLGQKADLANHTSILSLKTERIRVRHALAASVDDAHASGGGPDMQGQLIRELLTVHTKAATLSTENATAGDQWDLNKLRASVAWELATLEHATPGVTEGLKPAELAISAFGMLEAAVGASEAARDVGIDALAQQR